MKKFTCEFCGREFKNKLALWGHYPHCKERVLDKKKKMSLSERKEIEEELSIRELVFEINKRLAEISGLLRKIKENQEISSADRRSEGGAD